MEAFLATEADAAFEVVPCRNPDLDIELPFFLHRPGARRPRRPLPRPPPAPQSLGSRAHCDLKAPSGAFVFASGDGEAAEKL